MSTKDLNIPKDVNDLRVVHIDDIITVCLHVLDGRVWIHSEFHVLPRKSAIQRAVEVLVKAEVGLKAQGVHELWTTNQTPQEANFARHLGFSLQEETLAGNPVFRKDL